MIPWEKGWLLKVLGINTLWVISLTDLFPNSVTHIHPYIRPSCHTCSLVPIPQIFALFLPPVAPPVFTWKTFLILFVSVAHVSWQKTDLLSISRQYTWWQVVVTRSSWPVPDINLLLVVRCQTPTSLLWSSARHLPPSSGPVQDYALSGSSELDKCTNKATIIGGVSSLWHG